MRAGHCPRLPFLKSQSSEVLHGTRGPTRRKEMAGASFIPLGQRGQLKTCQAGSHLLRLLIPNPSWAGMGAGLPNPVPGVVLYPNHLHHFPVAAITNHPKPCCLKQHTCILLQFWRSKVSKSASLGSSQGVGRGIPSGGPRGESVSLSFPASRDHLHSSPQITPSSCSLHFWSQTLLPSSLKDPCGYIGSPDNPDSLPKAFNKISLPCEGIFTGPGD